ncbi:MAG: lysylphosphatidylglycerol synthase domain-containing protein, partial [Burkholderiales bacterium]
MRPARLLFGLAVAALCAACIAYVVHSFRWAEILAVVANAQVPQMLLGASLAIVAYLWLRTARWVLLLRAMGHPVPVSSAFEFTAFAVGIAVLTPASAAEMLKVELLERQSLGERVSGYSSFAAERVLDGLVLVVVGGAGALQSGLLEGSGQSAAVTAACALAAAALCAFMLGRRRASASGVLGTLLGTFTLGYRIYGPALAITVAGWLCIAIGWQACFSSLAVEISFHGTLTVMALSTVLSVLTFIPG